MARAVLPMQAWLPSSLPGGLQCSRPRGAFPQQGEIVEHCGSQQILQLGQADGSQSWWIHWQNWQVQLLGPQCLLQCFPAPHWCFPEFPSKAEQCSAVWCAWSTGRWQKHPATPQSSSWTICRQLLCLLAPICRRALGWRGIAVRTRRSWWWDWGL